MQVKKLSSNGKKKHTDQKSSSLLDLTGERNKLSLSTLVMVLIIVKASSFSFSLSPLPFLSLPHVCNKKINIFQYYKLLVFTSVPPIPELNYHVSTL